MWEVPKSCSGSYLGLAGSGLLPLLGAQKTNFFLDSSLFTASVGSMFTFLVYEIYEHTNIIAFLLLVLLKASGLIMN